jgi:hypothetical protein
MRGANTIMVCSILKHMYKTKDTLVDLAGILFGFFATTGRRSHLGLCISSSGASIGVAKEVDDVLSEQDVHYPKLHERMGGQKDREKGWIQAPTVNLRMKPLRNEPVGVIHTSNGYCVCLRWRTGRH